MKTIPVILTAALLLFALPALSLAHDGPRDRHPRGWVKQKPHHDHRRAHPPPKHWQRHHNSHHGGYGYCRPPQRQGHQHRDRRSLGLPTLVLQVRW